MTATAGQRNMAARRIAQETLDAVLQEKAKRFHSDSSGETIGETLPFKTQDLLRTVPRSRAEMFGDTHGDSRFTLSGSSAHSRDASREGLRGDTFPGPSFRSSAASISDDSYFRKEGSSRDQEFAHSDSQEQALGHRKLGHFHSQDWKVALRGSWEQDMGHPVSQESSWAQEFGLGPSAVLGDLGSSRRLEKEHVEKESLEYDVDRPGEADAVPRSSAQAQARARALSMVHEGGLLGKGDTQGLLIPKGSVGKLVTLRNVTEKKVPALNRVTPKTQGTNQTQKSSPNPSVALRTNPGPEDLQLPTLKIPLGLDLKNIRFPRRKMSFDIIDKADVFSRFGVEIIKWAGFHTVKDDLKFSQLFQTLFELETETCAKMLASFKCSLKPEHRDFCFFTIKFLKHSALKTPRVDNEFLNMLLDKGAVKTKNCFFEVIKPFDKYIMRLQDRLLKSVTPLLMACNAYELSVKLKTLTSPLDLALALETTNSLCRKSLALLGQTFALASSFRQEKILEAIGLQDIAPSPASFPNFEDSTLFGREYIDHLKAWLLASGCPLRVKRPGPQPSQEEDKTALPSKPEIPTRAPSDVLQRADYRMVDTIDQLVTRVLEGTLSPRERAALKEDPAYWFLSDENSLEYKYYKLKLAEAQRGSQTPASMDRKPAPSECAVRAMLYARAVQSLKRRLLPGQRRRLLRTHGLRGWKARRATTGTQTLLSSGTRLKPLGRQPKLPPPEGNCGAKDCPPDPTRAPPRDTSPAPKSSKPGGAAATAAKAPGTSAPCDPSDQVDPKTMETAEKLARFVAQVGPEIEQFSIENSADNPDLWFLHDQNSSAFKFYRKKVLELCPSIQFTSSPLTLPAGGGSQSGDSEESPTGTVEGEGEPEDQGPVQEVELESPEVIQEEEEEEEGDEADEEDTEGAAARGTPRPGVGATEAGAAEGRPPADGLPGEAAEDDTATAPGLSQTATGTCFPRKRMSSKSLRVGMIPAPKRVCLIQEPQVHEPVRIAYDRPRGRPLSKKKKPQDLDFAQQKLTDKNVGFQMLQKMGWKEGRGLGSCGRGIREPVSLGAASEGEGLGAEGPEQKEDTFDVFRQRMMQMYRHKRANK
ncbi:SURP and G-patch domain-containing protein 2 isoform X2 [Heterocephalus glaber]|uniref:SURP and G-patch domain-containing protein 2 n=2 Tax=Heterocephalus glaber TaxID=10181 RepID=A0A0P6JIG1_HETGA|nr:SURP and G-patch domain-containing protein 2 isoform X2 [Heterocephalus glaber]